MESLFDFAAAELERYAGFSKLVARGTLRLALKKAGLDPEGGGLTREQLAIVFDKLMPVELERRGVKEAERVCNQVVSRVTAEFEGGARELEIDRIFRRLGGV